MRTPLVVETIETRYNFGENSTDGIMVHAINRGVVVAPRNKSTKTMRPSINNSKGAITIVTIAIRITMPGGVGQTVK